MANNKMSPEKLLGFLNKTRSARDVSEKFTVTEATARKYLGGLVSAGQARIVGTKPTGSRGRPQTLFEANATTAPEMTPKATA